MSSEKVAFLALAAFVAGGAIGYRSGLSAVQDQIAALETRQVRQRERIEDACRILANVTPDDDGVRRAEKAALLIAVHPELDIP